MTRLLSLLTALILLASCSSYGKKVDQEQVSRFKNGKTTYSEVVQKLGKPTHSTINSDGTRMAMYSYAQSQMNAASFIPYVGAFVGGATTENTNVIFNFDNNSILTNYSASEGGASMGTGIISGQKQ